MLKFNSVLGSAGFGVANYNIEQIEIGVDSTLLNFLNSNYKYTELLSVQGESMQPIIQDGSIVFVDKSKMSINDSSIYAILIEDEVFIKKIEQNNDEYILKSINSQYQDIKTKELKIIGKVIGVLTKL
jgi:phage repressor protein C with HTH and peptisase S24 domain